MKNKNKTVVWANISKLIAIVAVIIDHCYGNLYYNRSIQKLLFFSTSIFVFVQGFTSYASYKNDSEKYFYKTINRIKSIFLNYTIASLIIYIIRNGCIDYNFLIEYLCFKVESPYYYVFLYIQMCLCTIPLIKLFSNGVSAFKYILYMIAVIAISLFSINYKLFNSILASGGYLFGGTFLLVLFCGISFGYYYSKIEHTMRLHPRKVLLCSFCELLVILVFMYIDRFRIDELVFGSIFYNPPNLTTILYSVSLSFFIYTLTTYLCSIKVKIFSGMISILNYFGKHTLYVFLYHKLLLDIIFNNCLLINIKYKTLLILPAIIAILLICILIENVLSYIITFFNKLIHNN